MRVVPMKQILDRAFRERYGVAAINIFNDRTLQAVRQTIEVGAEAKFFVATVEGEIEAIEGVERPPKIDALRISELVAAEPVPMVLHGGTGLSQARFDDLIARGCAKINTSTALKVRYVDANREFSQNNSKKFDLPSPFTYVREARRELAKAQIVGFHSAVKAA